MLIFCTILMAICHVVSPAAHTHHPHQSQEHSTVDFYYEPTSHYLIAITKSTCFMAALERDEYDHVHSNIGMDDLELVMLREWIGKLPETRIYHDDHFFPSTALTHCKGHDIYFLERSNATVIGSTRDPAASATSASG